MDRIDTHDSLDLLPWEILLEILYFLAFPELLTFTSSSKKYYNLREDIFFCKRYANYQFNFPLERFELTPFYILPLARLRQIFRWDRFVKIPPFRLIDLFYIPTIYVVSEDSISDLEQDQHRFYDELFIRFLSLPRSELILDLYEYRFQEGTHYLVGRIKDYYLFAQVRPGKGLELEGDGFWKYYLAERYDVLKNYLL